VHAHGTTAEALQISLIACALYSAIRLFESRSIRSTLLFGLILGLLGLTRGWVIPLGLLIAVMGLASVRERVLLIRLLLLSLPIAAALPALWLFACDAIQPFGGSPHHAWMAWNYGQINAPSLSTTQYFFKNAIWFAWPAWPF